MYVWRYGSGFGIFDESTVRFDCEDIPAVEGAIAQSSSFLRYVSRGQGREGPPTHATWSQRMPQDFVRRLIREAHLHPQGAQALLNNSWRCQ